MNYDWSLSNRDLARMHGPSREFFRRHRALAGADVFVRKIIPKPEPNCSALRELKLSALLLASPRFVELFWSHVCKEELVRSRFVDTPCWMWIGMCLHTKRGITYGRMAIRDGQGSAKLHLVHRLSFVIHHGIIPAGQLVRHKCDVKLCVNPEHVELGTYQDNAVDAFERGVCACGEKNQNCKLTEAKVMSMRKEFAADPQVPSLAAKYGVSQKTTWQVVQRESWRHVP